MFAPALHHGGYGGRALGFGGLLKSAQGPGGGIVVDGAADLFRDFDEGFNDLRQEQANSLVGAVGVAMEQGDEAGGVDGRAVGRFGFTRVREAAEENRKLVSQGGWLSRDNRTLDIGSRVSLPHQVHVPKSCHVAVWCGDVCMMCMRKN